jgi:uncharacterized protein with GYD domain
VADAWFEIFGRRAVVKTFITLISFTQRGEEAVGKSVDRASAFRAEAENAGARVKQVYWTLGQFDGVLIFEAPDDQTAATLMISLASKGNVRTQTLMAYDSDQFKSILDHVS